jgi:hypothetical protein
MTSWLITTASGAAVDVGPHVNLDQFLSDIIAGHHATLATTVTICLH